MATPYSRLIVGGLPWYSALIVLGIALAVLLGKREEGRLGLAKDTMLDVALVAVPCGIVGARLYYVAMEWRQFAQNPITALYVWEGGIAIYGAVLGGMAGLYVYARRKRLALGTLLDMAAPGLLLAQAIGRWGNYFNQEAYGPAVTLPSWQFFPFAVQIGGAAGTWHMATFFYESAWNAVGFLALWALRKRRKHPGDVFFFYLLLYGSGRFLIEQLRTDSLWIGGVRASQYLSLLLCLCAACVLIARACRDTGRSALWPLCVALLPIARLFAPHTWLYGLALGLLALPAIALRPGKAAWGFWAIWLADGAVWLTSFTIVPDSLALSYLHTICCGASVPAYALWAHAVVSRERQPA